VAACAGAFHFVSSNNFAAPGLAEPLLRALNKARLFRPTPIQATAIPRLLAGREGSQHRLGGPKSRVVAMLAGVSGFLQIQRMRGGDDIVSARWPLPRPDMGTGEPKLQKIRRGSPP